MPLFIKIPDTLFTDLTLPRVPKDPWITPYTRCLFDLTNINCTGGLTTLLNNGTLNNLVYDAPSATVKLTASLPILGGGIYLPGGQNYFDLGNSYSLASMGGANFIAICWFMQDANFSTANYQGIFGRSLGGATSIEYMIGTASDVPSLRMSNAAGTVVTVGNGVTSTKNVPTQLAMSWVNGTVAFHINGVQVSSTTLSAPLATAAASTWVGNMQSGTNGFKGKIFRFGIETLPAGTSAGTRIAADYTGNNTGKFTNQVA